LSGSAFQILAAATGKARPRIVGSLKDGTARRFVAVDRRVRRPGTSARRVLIGFSSSAKLKILAS